MRLRRLPLRLILPAGLIVLVGVLATLEYRWLGQVSEADRSRRRASLQQHAEEFANDFDRELLRVYALLQTDGTAVAAGAWEPFARHFDSWRETAIDPRILHAVYLVDGAPPSIRIREYHADKRAFVEATWPQALAPIRDHLTALFKDSSSAGRDRWVILPPAPFEPAVPALVVNLSSMRALEALDPAGLVSFGPTSGLLIAYLDEDALRTSLLPTLAARYFPQQDADSYRLEIVGGRDRATPILARGLAPGATIDPVKADADVSLFTLRPELLSQFLTRSLVTRDFKVGSTEVKNFTTTDQAMAPRASEPPAHGAGGAMAGGTIAFTSRTVTAGRGGGRASGSLQIVVQDQPADVMRLTTTPAGAPWQLILQHSAGSLDQAVNQARRRNLWLSFGILGVLGVGVGLIVINAQRSERLAAQQMDFVATVSHELRTPLAVIRSAAQNLSSGVVLDVAQAKKYGEVIDAEGRRLTDMVEQVLEYAGLSGGRRPAMARPVDLGALASEALASCEPLVASGRFEVAVDISRDLPPVFADEGAIRRALQNLITNALKYGADGRWLGVSVKPGPPRVHEVQVIVTDRGRGIEAADLPHIFDAFYRGRRAVDEQIHGNGLGLSLVKRIAEAHGGRVTVRSSPGEGASFTIHLPMIEAHVRPKTRHAWADLADADVPRT